MDMSRRTKIVYDIISLVGIWMIAVNFFVTPPDGWLLLILTFIMLVPGAFTMVLASELSRLKKWAYIMAFINTITVGFWVSKSIFSPDNIHYYYGGGFSYDLSILSISAYFMVGIYIFALFLLALDWRLFFPKQQIKI